MGFFCIHERCDCGEYQAFFHMRQKVVHLFEWEAQQEKSANHRLGGACCCCLLSIVILVVLVAVVVVLVMLYPLYFFLFPSTDYHGAHQTMDFKVCELKNQPVQPLRSISTVYQKSF